MLSVGQKNTCFSERIDLGSDHRGVAAVNRVVEVTVGYQAHSLVPRVVFGCEMVSYHFIAQFLLHQVEQLVTHLGRFGPGLPVEEFAELCIPPACDPVGHVVGQDFAESVRDGVNSGA